uniref:Uncharacterized protein n=1 Tax=Arundo donax TaxID=35708 RepID=A0A0A9GCQ5_ARUDO
MKKANFEVNYKEKSGEKRS